MQTPDNRLAATITRRRGRPSSDDIAARQLPTPAAVDPSTGRTRCPLCGHPTLVADGKPRKSDGGISHRCTTCGHRCTRLVMLAPV